MNQQTIALTQQGRFFGRSRLLSQMGMFGLMTMLLLCVSACGGGSGGSGESSTAAKNRSWITRWNRIAIDASGRDHTATGAKEQVGPVRSARAMAITHIAMADAVAAISGSFRSFLPVATVPADTSIKAAIAQAGHDSLVFFFPTQAAIFDAALAEDLAAVADGPAKDTAIQLGKQTAEAIIDICKHDRSDESEPVTPISYEPKQTPGKWRPDPINPNQTPIGSKWFRVIPLVLPSADAFRLPPPPDIASAEYAAAYDEAKRLGGDGITTPTERTEEQSLIGLYWAYDGTPSLCAPPRLYNQIAVQLGEERNLDVVHMTRLLALVNLSLNEAGVAAWESKYVYEFWRPVAGIREADAGTGPTGAGDGNPITVGDVNWTPLGAPASNLSANNFTPPFPAYPSGHATFGGALFETLRKFFGTDNIQFTFVSDELNGTTLDNQGNARPLIPRTFRSLSEAEEENGQSRIYLGIHWAFDKTEGIRQGRQVADLVFENTYQPIGE